MTASGALPIVITPGADRRAVPAHRRDVRRLGDRRHHEGDAHRSRHGVHAMSELVMEATDVAKVLGDGRRADPRAEGRRPGAQGRRADAADGAVGERQDHAAFHSRLHADADRRNRSRPRRLDRGQESRGPGQAAAGEHRLRVPVLSPVSDAVGRRQRAAGARCARRDRQGRAKVKSRAALDRVGLSSKTRNYPRAAQRRRAAAGGDCARGGRRSVGDPCRRADRGAGQRERQGHHGHPRGRSPRTPAAAFWWSPTIRGWCRSPTGSSISRTA